MDELFFGVKKMKKNSRKKPERKSPKRKSPKRKSPKRKSPKRKSPKRKTIMCNKKLSLAKLRKLCIENSVNIFSEKKLSINKKTGLLKKPKMVGCSTLMKRLNEAGLSHLYKIKKIKDEYVPEGFFIQEEISPSPKLYNIEEETKLLDIPKDSINPIMKYQTDPVCNDEFLKLGNNQPSFVEMSKFFKTYKGFEIGQGPCDKRNLIPRIIPSDEEDKEDYAKEADFDMSYGIRYTSGARPKKTQKHVGTIVVKGRKHHVFRGKEGGLYYLKGKTGSKIYINKDRLKK
jgi:hypothetical protein